MNACLSLRDGEAQYHTRKANCKPLTPALCRRFRPPVHSVGSPSKKERDPYSSGIVSTHLFPIGSRG